MNGKKQIKVAVAGILLDGNKILLNLTDNGEGNKEWDLPEGHLEFGESFEECIIREFKEETDLDVEAERLVSVAPNKEYGNHYIVFAFLMKAKSKMNVKRKEPELHLAWEWFDISNLPDNLFITAKNAIRDYKTGQIYNSPTD